MHTLPVHVCRKCLMESWARDQKAESDTAKKATSRTHDRHGRVLLPTFAAKFNTANTQRCGMVLSIQRACVAANERHKKVRWSSILSRFVVFHFSFCGMAFYSGDGFVRGPVCIRMWFYYIFAFNLFLLRLIIIISSWLIMWYWRLSGAMFGRISLWIALIRGSFECGILVHNIRTIFVCVGAKKSESIRTLFWANPNQHQFYMYT